MKKRLGLYRRRRTKSPQRPVWKKYWKNDPAPEIIAPNTHGAFRETALQCPLEDRDQRGPYIGLYCIRSQVITLHYNVFRCIFKIREGLSWSWSYGSWIYNYLCNQCLSLLTLWVQTLFMARCTRYNILSEEVCQWLTTGIWFSLGTPVSSTKKKTDRHDIAEILLKMALNTLS
jgi:hypothetical protein